MADRSRDFWYPVALSSDVDKGLVAVQLLEESIVLGRIGGELSALSNLCIHRGTPLSMGRLQDDTLICAYHGWTYNAEGKVVRIPQRGPEEPIPPKARVPRYAAREKYGAIWVCLGESATGIPDFPEYDDPSCRTVFVGTHEWDAGAARMMENFLDVGHFPFVHPDLLGDERRPEVKVGPLEEFDIGFSYLAENELPGPDGAWQSEPIQYTYTAPYNFRIVRERERVVSDDTPPDEGRMPRYVLIISIQPISPRRSRRYTWVSRNYALDPENDARFVEFLEVLAEQDREIVENQRPEDLPLDITAEMHIKGVDAPAIHFRRLLAQIGLEESALEPGHQARA